MSDYQCHVCLLRFSSFDELESHIETSHSEDGRWRQRNDALVLLALKKKREAEERKYAKIYGAKENAKNRE